MTKNAVYRRNKLKRGRYKPLSKRKHSINAQTYKQVQQNLLNSPSVHISLDLRCSAAKLKTYNTFFWNKLEAYKRIGRSHNLRTIEDILALNFEKDNRPKWHSTLVFSFVVSDNFVSKLRQLCERIVLVVDGFQNNSTVKKEQISKDFIIFNPPRNFDANIPSSFHPKLIILRYKSLLRVVIGSGNFLCDDWNKYANVFWTQDYTVQKN